MHFDSKELRFNEIFLGNTSKTEAYPPIYLSALKTIRLGSQAYDIDGNKLSPDYCRPIFLDKNEEGLYDQIMTKLSKNMSFPHYIPAHWEPLKRDVINRAYKYVEIIHNESYILVTSDLSDEQIATLTVSPEYFLSNAPLHKNY